MERFLIVKTSALGDIIHTFPVVQYLRSHFPHAHIDWVVEEQGVNLIRAHPEISRVICVKTKKWRRSLLSCSTWQEIKSFRKELQLFRYDYVFDLQGNVKSGWITSTAKATRKIGFGWKTVSEWPNFFCTSQRYNPPKGYNIREDYLAIVKESLEDKNQTIVSDTVQLKISSEQRALVDAILSLPILQQRKKVLVCPGSAWPNKQMTEETLGLILQKAERRSSSAFLLIWGNQAELQIAKRLQANYVPNSVIVDRLELPVLQQLMASVDLVISVDSLPLHLAGTTSVPTFSVFGPSTLKKYQPLGPQHCGVQGVCPYGRTFEKRCPVLRTCPTGLCIHGLDASIYS